MITLPKLAWPREPYRGIEQFRFIDRPIFFERRDEIRRLVRLVSIYRGTLLYGESGTGKSSVINAGLIPAMLEEGFLPERLRVQPIPGAELVVERIALTEEGAAPFLPSRFAADEEPRTRLVFSTADIGSRLAVEHEGGAPLLIFDQFEEFVTLFEEAPENREKFAEAARAQETLLKFFRDLLRDETLPVKLLFVFREDYLAKLSRLFALVPNLRDQHVRLTSPGSGVLKNLIRGPFTNSEVPPEHFGRIISDALADKLCAALEERSDAGTVNLTEVQIASLSLWRDPKAELLFDASTKRSEAVQHLLEGHLTGSLDRLSTGLREPAVAVLRHLVTSAGTRNIILEADLIERLHAGEKIPPETGRRALAELSGQSRLVRRQRRNEAYFYDITSEFLVPWIQRQRALSDGRIAMRKWRKRVALAVATLLTAVLAVSGVLIYLQREAAKDAADAARIRAQEDQKQINEKQKALEQTAVVFQQQLKAEGRDNTKRALDAVKAKESSTEDVVAPITDTPKTPPPPAAEIAGAAEYVTDKLFVGHERGVWTARYSPANYSSGGQRVAFVLTASRDHTARAFDLRGDNDTVLRGHRGEVNFALFRPLFDPSTWVAATASDDATIGLWNAAGDKPLFLQKHAGPVTGLAWSRDGSWLASTSADKTVRIWDLRGPTPTDKVLNGHTGSVWLPDLVELKDATLLATPSSDGTARLWHFPDGEPVVFSGNSPEDREVLRHGAPVRRAVVDPKGQSVLTAGADGRAILWDRRTGWQLAVASHEKAVRDVAFKSDGSLFVTASADNTAQVWDARTGKGVVTLKGHTGCVFSARFTTFGPGVVTVSWDQTARLWNYETKRCVAILRGHLDVLWSVEFSPNGATFTTTSADGTARLWDLKRVPGGDAFLPPPIQQRVLVK